MGRIKPHYGGKYTYRIWTALIFSFSAQLKNKALNIAGSYPDWKLMQCREAKGFKVQRTFVQLMCCTPTCFHCITRLCCAVKLEGCALQFSKMNIKLNF